MRGKIILASKSKRRSSILKCCNIPHTVIPSSVRELHYDAKKPNILVMWNARIKAETVARTRRKGVIFGIDTLVLFNGKLIGKPRTKRDAKQTLRTFSGKHIIVYSGIHVIDLDRSKEISGFDKTSIYVKEIPEKDIDKYFKLLGPYDKAGGFSIEGIGSIVFDNLKGSYFNVLGLPMGLLQRLFKEIGLDILDFVKK